MFLECETRPQFDKVHAWCVNEVPPVVMRAVGRVPRLTRTWHGRAGCVAPPSQLLLAHALSGTHPATCNHTQSQSLHTASPATCGSVLPSSSGHRACVIHTRPRQGHVSPERYHVRGIRGRGYRTSGTDKRQGVVRPRHRTILFGSTMEHATAALHAAFF